MFTQVSAGGAHTCGLRADGVLTCWGSNDVGQARPPSGAFAQVSAGVLYTCGLRADGSAACWGVDAFDLLTPPAGPFTQVSAEGFHACGLRADGSVTSWGDLRTELAACGLVSTGCDGDADCDDGVACTLDQCAPTDADADPRGCVHRAGCPAAPCEVGTCDLELGECTFVPVADGTTCSDGNSCAADVCVLGQCLESATCEEITVPEVVTAINVKKVKIVAAAEGERGDVWRAQGFVDGVAETGLSSIASQLSAADAQASCTNIKPIQEVTNQVKARVGNKGRVRLKLKLNPIGRCLLGASVTGDLTVRVEATITRKNPQTGEPKNELLNRLVRIVRGG